MEIDFNTIAIEHKPQQNKVKILKEKNLNAEKIGLFLLDCFNKGKISSDKPRIPILAVIEKGMPEIKLTDAEINSRKNKERISYKVMEYLRNVGFCSTSFNDNSVYMIGYAFNKDNQVIIENAEKMNKCNKYRTELLLLAQQQN